MPPAAADSASASVRLSSVSGLGDAASSKASAAAATGAVMVSSVLWESTPGWRGSSERQTEGQVDRAVVIRMVLGRVLVRAIHIGVGQTKVVVDDRRTGDR